MQTPDYSPESLIIIARKLKTISTPFLNARRPASVNEYFQTFRLNSSSHSLLILVSISFTVHQPVKFFYIVQSVLHHV